VAGTHVTTPANAHERRCVQSTRHRRRSLMIGNCHGMHPNLLCTEQFVASSHVHDTICSLVENTDADCAIKHHHCLNRWPCAIHFSATGNTFLHLKRCSLFQIEYSERMLLQYTVVAYIYIISTHLQHNYKSSRSSKQ